MLVFLHRKFADSTNSRLLFFILNITLKSNIMYREGEYSMFKIDKQSFGSFVSMLRKEKGFSQKELAEKLMVSDKAVSKWETGHSLPDITLLIPLAEILDVTVTELLECRRIENAARLKPEDVEALVKTAITFSEPDEDKKRETKRKRGFIYLGTISIFILELLLLHILGYGKEHWFNGGIILTSGMSLVFGAYFWLFAKDRLPAYYDENKISVYSDGFFRMNMPGIYFNNSNWKHIIRGLRWWSSASAVAFPIITFLGSMLFKEIWDMAGMLVMGLLLLVSLFVPIYVLGKKHN